MESDKRTPDWFTLLRFCQDYGGRYGLTLPFIIGACRSRTSKHATAAGFEDLHRLLTSMRDHISETRYVLINECNMLRQPVAALGYTHFKSPGYVHIKSPGHDYCSLLVQPQYIPDETRGFDSAAERLWQIYQAAISKGWFSHRNGEYRPFDDADHNYIERAFSTRYEDDESV